MPINVHIKNVQSIKDVEFQINGFTCVVGKSNIGKSSLLRSIRNMLKNKGGIVRDGAKFCEVFYDDGALKIHWKKGATNAYIINEKEYIVGRDIPDPILDAGIREIEIGSGASKTKIDAQTNHQFNPLFLVDRKPREAAEIISTVSRLDVVSKAGRECNRDLKGLKGKYKLRLADKKHVEAQLKNFKEFDDITKNYNSIIIDLQQIKEKDKKVVELVEINSQLKQLFIQSSLYKEIKQFKLPEFTIETHLELINALKDQYKRLTLLQTQVSILSDIEAIIIPKVDINVNIVQELKKVHEDYKLLSQNIRFGKEIRKILLPELNELELLINEADKLKQILMSYSEKKEEVAENEEHLRKILSKLEQIEEKKTKLEKELGSCPVCGAEFHD